ncbi:hypothetical protein [Streptomyces sp. CB01881]|uniref:hypothetical protein n=1 Tax=Streptomyces sp. CB01881 TaxID=2078691 RepID=UPI000CDC0116|nr:hypothetical protein [Streptomyces sp. CB01881]AUY50915.1 hypothetical protein C2142_20440 [Streptomyces sp. CB01881]TYC74298.1 hypothetical protein EH183_20405 [Streptomyces sp. CB01881]
MHIHRTELVRNFTVLPNGLLQDRRLSYTARGLLADLLSRPDGWREDGRHMADTSPQGRGPVRRALKELTEAGYYRVEKIRMPDGRIRSEAHVYDTPQRALPGATRPAAGEAGAGSAGVPVVKNRKQEPTLPAELADEADEAGVLGVVGASDEQVREAVAVLFRAIRPEPRLRLGEPEAVALAPLVAQWLERGSTAADLTRALLPALPVPMHSAAGVLRYRLVQKMPPVPEAGPPPVARLAECAECRDPVPQPGICGACAGVERRPAPAAGGAAVTVGGVARARAILLAGKAALAGPRPAVAPAG